MTYVCWAAMFEGSSDRAYFEVLIPRVMEILTAEHGTRSVTVPTSPAILFKRAAAEAVAKEACRQKDAFYLIFVHADTGGRHQEQSVDSRSAGICQAMANQCEWPQVRCIPIAPRKEVEAWLLCDAVAIASALGFRGRLNELGLPSDGDAAERLIDPKATLTNAIRRVRKKRVYDAQQMYAAIAQRQDCLRLRTSPSYVEFENSLHDALADLRCVKPRQ